MEFEGERVGRLRLNEQRRGPSTPAAAKCAAAYAQDDEFVKGTEESRILNF